MVLHLPFVCLAGTVDGINEARLAFGQKLAAKASLEIGNIASCTEFCEESESEVKNGPKLSKKHNFENFKLSIKASDIFMMTESYRKISKLIDQPLHLGLTEAGGKRSGTIKSSIAIGQLRQKVLEIR